MLLPVKLVGTVSATAQEATPPHVPVPAGVIEIDIGAARVRLRGSVDEASVRCVLQALRAIA